MIRLGYLVPEFPSQTHAFFWRESQWLASSGFEVTYLSTRRPPRDACAHAFATKAHADTIYLFPPRPGDTAVLARNPVGLARALRYVTSLRGLPHRERAQLLALVLCAARLVAVARERRLQHIHVHSCANAAHLAALARLLGGPSYSLTLHGDLEVYGTHHAEKMSGAAFVSPVTKPLQQELIATLNRKAETTPVILMGVDTGRFVDAGKRSFVGRSLRLVTVARLNAVKGHVHAFAAVARLRDEGLDVTYSLAGAGPHESALRADVDRLGLKDRVHFLGTISEDQVLSLLQESDALVLPSVGRGEASPVAVMEAMSCSLPVVCSLIGGTGDMITDGVDGFLTPQGGEDDLCRVLRSLAVDLDLRRRVGMAGRARAEHQFDHGVNAAKLAAAIRGVVSGG